MAAKEEWHYAKNGRQFGPVSAADMKRLASTGELSATDLVWKHDMADWKKAASIKGLFPIGQSATSSPPPIPKSATDSSDTNGRSQKANVAEAVKSDLTDIMGAAKKAKDLTVAHARRTQINQMTLPNAYLSLGKDVFANERFREEFCDLFGKITATNDEIAKVKTSADERPPATDLKGKVKSGAVQLVAKGQATKLGFQRDSLIRALGKKAFESHGDSAGPQELISPIRSAVEELSRLDAQIKSSPSSKRIPIWQRVPIAALLTVCCFPVGLALVLFNPRLSRSSKTMWIGGFAAFFVCMMAISQVVVQKARKELAAAHQLWSSGDKQAAISKYRVMIREDLRIIPESDRSLILGRVIDFDAEMGNDSSVEALLRQADEAHIVPTISSEKARALIATRVSEPKKSPPSPPLSRFSIRQQADYIVKHEFGLSAEEANAMFRPGKEVAGLVYKEREGDFDKERRVGVVCRGNEELKHVHITADRKIDRIEALSRDGKSFYPKTVWSFDHYSFDLPAKSDGNPILTHPASITELDGTGWRIGRKLTRFYSNGNLAYECYGTSNNGAIDYRKHDSRNRYWDISGKEMDMDAFCAAAGGKDWQDHFSNSEAQKGRRNVENFLDSAKQKGLINDKGANDVIRRMENSGALPNK